MQQQSQFMIEESFKKKSTASEITNISRIIMIRKFILQVKKKIRTKKYCQTRNFNGETWII